MADISHLLNYHPAIYNPHMLTKGATKLTEKEMRKEYSRLRSIARKRLERMGKTQYKKMNFYQYNKNKFVPLKELKTPTQIAYKLSDVVRFLSSDLSTIKGIKKMHKKTVATLQSDTPERKGYKNITEENLAEFGNFMEFARAMLSDIEFDSDRVARLFDAMVGVTDTWRKKVALIKAYKDHTRTDNENGKNLTGMKSGQWMRKELGISIE